MVVTAYARDYDSFTYYFTLLITPMALLSGTYFPLSRFPLWAQALSHALPLSHAVVLTRSLFLGQWSYVLLWHVAVLILLALLFTNWSIAQVRRRLIY